MISKDKALQVWGEVDGLTSSVRVVWPDEEEGDPEYEVRIEGVHEMNGAQVQSLIQVAQTYGREFSIEQFSMSAVIR